MCVCINLCMYSNEYEILYIIVCYLSQQIWAPVRIIAPICGNRHCFCGVIPLRYIYVYTYMIIILLWA